MKKPDWQKSVAAGTLALEAIKQGLMNADAEKRAKFVLRESLDNLMEGEFKDEK